MISVPSGATISVKEMFLDEYGIPLVPNTAPHVKLLDDENDVAFFSYANQDIIPGKWVSDITVPRLENKDVLEFSIVWLFDSGRVQYKSTENILIEPSVQERESESVVLIGDSHFVINVPFLIRPTSRVVAEFYDNNQLLYALSHTDASIKVHLNKHTSNLTLPLTVTTPSVYSRTLLLRYPKTDSIVPETLTYKIWVATPAMLNVASQLENFVNKSRISNVIPELRYAQSDLMLALSKGLETFNSLGPALSSFTGTNMQGVLLESWIVCACISLLNMQYMAEGSLAFEFSGQSVSLNIDRTQYIESMLGKLDTMLENQVKPLKKLLAKNGITTGDGSVGGSAMNSNFGLTRLSMSPTTRFFNGYARNFHRYW
jgi:hypothetical protein